MEVEIRSWIQKAARGYYYLAPLWFLAERLFWPGFRSGAFVGRSLLGAAAFYAAEGALGAAFWRANPWASRLALAENVAYLVAIMRRVLLTPLDVAAALDVDPDAAQALAGSYQGFLFGVLIAGFQIFAHHYAKRSDG